MRIIILILLFFSLQSQGQIIRANPNYRPFAVAASCDTDAQKFIDSTGITDATQVAAICTLVKELKDSSLWTSMYAIYPMVGGTAATHKWNLKDVRNLDAAYRLTFSGTWTHSSTGADPNGTDAWANTFFNSTSASVGQNSFALSYYSRDDVTCNCGELGNNGTHGSQLVLLYGAKGGAGNYSNVNAGTSNFIVGDNGAVVSGFFSISRTAANVTTYYKNGGQYGNVNTAASTGVSNVNLYLGALNNGSNTASFFSPRQCATAIISAGLTSDNERALNTIVEKFNDALSRGVQ